MSIMNNLIVVVEVSLNIEKDVKNILGSIIDFPANVTSAYQHDSIMYKSESAYRGVIDQ